MPVQQPKWNLEKQRFFTLAISAAIHFAVGALLFVVAPTKAYLAEGLTLEFLDSPAADTKKPIAVPLAKTRSLRPKPRISSAGDPPDASEPVESATELSPVSQPYQEANVGASAEPGEMNRYVADVILALQKNRQYPRDAVRREEEGVVALAVTIRSDGTVAEARVTEASAFESLNRAAIKTVEKVGVFPKPPASAGASIDLRIPLRFKIERL